jgi:threonine dehydrogenase-like Zn-dependent dehydrogenase
MTTASLPKSTRAAVMHAFNSDLVVEDVPLPSALEPGAVLIQTEAATLCGSDIHQWKDEVAHTVLPVILGHEMTGTVLALGEGADTDSLGKPVKVGDRLIWSSPSCGKCYICTMLEEPVMCPNRLFGSRQRTTEPPYAIGGLSQYIYVPGRSSRIAIDRSARAAWVSAASCAGKTVVRAFERAGGITPGQSVVVLGCGPLGLFGTALAAASGAGSVIVTGAPAHRLNVARRLGATETIDITEVSDAERRIEKVRALTGGRGAEVLLDFAGGPGVFREMLHMAAIQARCVSVGSVTGGPFPVENRLITSKELTIIGSRSAELGYHLKALQFMQRSADLFDWDAMFDAPCGLDGAGEAIRAMAELRAVKPVIAPSDF